MKRQRGALDPVLADASLTATIPVTDLQAAHGFYGETLGLEIDAWLDEEIRYTASSGARLAVFEREEASWAEHALAAFEVDDLDRVVHELEQLGVEFQSFQAEGLEMEGAIAERGGERIAWMLDPDGNVLALTESAG